MRAVTFQGRSEVSVDERPQPQLSDPEDAIVKVEASGICGSDLHIYHGRVDVEQGFTLGHEYVGTVIAVGDSIRKVAIGDRVLGCFHSACGTCFYCLSSDYHRCVHSRTFGHGSTLGSLQGTQAELALVPHADLVLRRVPDSISADAALFAGDVMATAYHAVDSSELRPGETVAVLGLGPVGLCAVQVAKAAGASHVIAVDSVEDRLRVAESFGAKPVHLVEQDAREVAREVSEGRGVDVCIEAVGDPKALEAAIKLTRPCGRIQCIGVFAERVQLHLGLLWLKAITLRGGQANAIRHVDRVIAMMSAGVLDPTPLVSCHMPLEAAPEAYARYDRREALKIVLTP